MTTSQLGFLKGFYNTTRIGPCLVLNNAIPDPQVVPLKCSPNDIIASLAHGLEEAHKAYGVPSWGIKFATTSSRPASPCIPTTPFDSTFPSILSSFDIRAPRTYQDFPHERERSAMCSRTVFGSASRLVDSRAALCGREPRMKSGAVNTPGEA
ncbi:hypothetical protein BV22DRAFT_1134347 [Leucogyrophana mollusca]|uniref:Uncharacterized protein n=1 Tax=Leucogyrophana mollusca TaxID=85980 RepID=A0ACB8AYY1_9AGAM|nr:hypothetical protein BV22DRAFT_1134347 [Leucogyrophana mollusca]